MNLVQDKLVLAATAVAESAWIFAMFGVLGIAIRGSDDGIVTGGDGSPLSWPAILAVLSSAIVATRLLQNIAMPAKVWTALQVALGGLVIYLTIASQIDSGSRSLELGWITRLGTTSNSDVYWLTGVFGTLMAIGLWWRGGRLAWSENPFDSLMASFKIGILVIAVVAIVDSQHEADLDIYPIMFVFIGAALGGLAISRLLPSSSPSAKTGRWSQVIVAVVSGIVAIGLFLGLVLNRLVPLVSRGSGGVMEFLSENVAGGLAEAIARPIFLFVEWVISWFVIPDPQDPGAGFTPRGEFVEEIREVALDRGAPVIFEIIGWTLLGIVAALAVYFLIMGLRRKSRGRWEYKQGRRESLLKGADPLQDLASLLLGLIPERFRRGDRPRELTLPDAEPGVVEAFRIYYQLLTMAEAKGVNRAPAETPVEFQTKLESIFPRRLVRMATGAFDRACYGDQPSPEQLLGEIRSSLRAIVAPAR